MLLPLSPPPPRSAALYSDTFASPLRSRAPWPDVLTDHALAHTQGPTRDSLPVDPPIAAGRRGRRLPERLFNKFPRPPPSRLLHPVAEPVSPSPCLSGPSGSIPGRSRLRPGGERGSPHPGHRVVAPAPPPLAGCSSALRPRAPVSRRRRRRRSVSLPALRSPGPRRGTRRKEPRSDPGLARALPTLSARPGSSARRRRRRRPACIRARGGSARPCCSGTPPACAARSRPARVARSPRRCSDPGPRPRDCRRRPRAPLGRVPGQVSESAE